MFAGTLVNFGEPSKTLSRFLVSRNKAGINTSFLHCVGIETRACCLSGVAVVAFGAAALLIFAFSVFAVLAQPLKVVPRNENRTIARKTDGSGVASIISLDVLIIWQ